MELITVTFDRVFEISRGLTSPPYVEFSFQAGSMKQYSVRVPGSPVIGPGMMVTALLGQPGNWQTLKGCSVRLRSVVPPKAGGHSVARALGATTWPAMMLNPSIGRTSERPFRALRATLMSNVR